MQSKVMILLTTFVCFGWDRRDRKSAIWLFLIMTYVKRGLFEKSDELVAFAWRYCVLSLVYGDFLRFGGDIWLKYKLQWCSSNVSNVKYSLISILWYPSSSCVALKKSIRQPTSAIHLLIARWQLLLLYLSWRESFYLSSWWYWWPEGTARDECLDTDRSTSISTPARELSNWERPGQVVPAAVQHICWLAEGCKVVSCSPDSRNFVPYLKLIIYHYHPAQLRNWNWGVLLTHSLSPKTFQVLYKLLMQSLPWIHYIFSQGRVTW